MCLNIYYVIGKTQYTYIHPFMQTVQQRNQTQHSIISQLQIEREKQRWSGADTLKAFSLAIYFPKAQCK